MSVNSLPLVALTLLAPLAFQAHAEPGKKYQRGVADAAFVEKNEIATDLNAINSSNDTLVWNEDKSKVLVATWKSQGSYEDSPKPRTTRTTPSG